MQVSESKASIVWEIFRQISDIPRRSKNEEKMTAWLIVFAEKYGLEHRTDDVGNVVIVVNATPGMEAAPTVILQGHIDMVCEKTPDSPHDFTKDAIAWIERDGWLYADNTTLGADNGIGVALALAVAVNPLFAHPRLELLMTVDEETGLTGALALKKEFISGQRLLNIDSEDEGVLTIGCAGGNQADLYLKLEAGSITPTAHCFDVSVAGLRGGHSGVNIALNRGNAIKILAELCQKLEAHESFSLVAIKGGSAHNAIPRNAEARVFYSDEVTLRRDVGLFENELKQHFSSTDPDLKMHVVSCTTGANPWNATSTKTLLQLLCQIPNGVYRYSNDIPDLVETSNILAELEVCEGVAHILTSQRSSLEEQLQVITNKVREAATGAAASIEVSLGYPAWQPDSQSELLKIAKEVYGEMASKEPIIEIIHAGLECGVIGGLFPGIDMISFGPTIENPHSPKERLCVADVDRVWKFLGTYLQRLTVV